MSADPSRIPPQASAIATSRISCVLDNDPRLIGSLGAIMAHAANRAGFPEETREQLATAAVEASRELLVAGPSNGNPASTTNVVLEEFRDRVEVTIESSVGAPTEGIRRRLAGKVADCVKSEGDARRVRISLSKPCGETKSSPKV